MSCHRRPACVDPRVDSVRKALSNAKAFQQALSLMKSMSRTPRHEELERVEAVAVEPVSPIAARIRKSLSELVFEVSEGSEGSEGSKESVLEGSQVCGQENERKTAGLGGHRGVGTHLSGRFRLR